MCSQKYFNGQNGAFWLSVSSDFLRNFSFFSIRMIHIRSVRFSGDKHNEGRTRRESESNGNISLQCDQGKNVSREIREGFGTVLVKYGYSRFHERANSEYTRPFHRVMLDAFTEARRLSSVKISAGDERGRKRD